MQMNRKVTLYFVRKSDFCLCENKDADQLRRYRQADQRLCFRHTDTVQFLIYLNPKFQISSHLLWLYSPVCVGPGRKQRRLVFSQRASYCKEHLSTLDILLWHTYRRRGRYEPIFIHSFCLPPH